MPTIWQPSRGHFFFNEAKINNNIVNNFWFIESIAFCRSQISKKDIMFNEDFDFFFFWETKDGGGISDKGNKNSNKKYTKKWRKSKIYKTIWIGWWFEVCRARWIKKLGRKTWIPILKKIKMWIRKCMKHWTRVQFWNLEVCIQKNNL